MIKLNEVETTPQDDGGSFCLTLKAHILNSSNKDIGFVRYHTIIQNSSGATISGSTISEEEKDVCKGEEEDFEDMIFIDNIYMGGSNKYSANTFARLYEVENHNLGKITAPQNSEKIEIFNSVLNSKLINSNLKISLIRRGPDEDKLYDFGIRCGLKNIAPNLIECHLFMNVCDEKGNPIDGGDIKETIPEGQIGYLNMDVYGFKKSQIKSPVIQLKLRVYSEVSSYIGSIDLLLPS